MRVLFVGGTGTISSGCLQPALDKGHEVFIFNRGQHKTDVPPAVVQIRGDARNKEEMAKLASSHRFDVMANFIGFAPNDVALDVEVFGGKISQYIYISSASIYQKPPNYYIATESSPLRNPFNDYSRRKIACEEFVMKAFREKDFPATIVRPSHTYGDNIPGNLPGVVDYTLVDRLRSGKEVVVHGDGETLWTFTHNSDFGFAFADVLGNMRTIGETYHITSDEVITWNQHFQIVARECGGTANMVHIPSDFIQTVSARAATPLLGDRTYSIVFDNSKIRSISPGSRAKVSFAEGVRRAVAYYESHPEAKTINQQAVDMLEQILAAWHGQGR
ncbi:MAG: NAD-dependent epimerase/dehydratase family protein [Candidatus Sumerlaeota bacterium]|nr:NAD-dependent epimerase/dehydratase family protein [Candidatus Sumerlaeota bacterium]